MLSMQTRILETIKEIPGREKHVMDFVLPKKLEASEPPEARGLQRDEVRLMVSDFCNQSLNHTRFRQLKEYLQPGDVLVINTSATINAALPACRADGQLLYVHLSTRLQAALWVVELRQPGETGTEPYLTAKSGETLALPAEGYLQLLTPYRPEHRRPSGGQPAQVRLWLAELVITENWQDYLARHGFPIRYKYVHQRWPLAYYQTVFATEPGSAEMPSAGRAFTPEIITELVAHGIQIAPLVLHTGVASLEAEEPPYEEYFRISAATAQVVNHAHHAGARVIAVGTTAVRALESAASVDHQVHPFEGWTDLVITPERGLFVVDGLLTGMHEPRSSHLMMLAALAGYDHIVWTYRAALECGYLWHEFGDLHLILPGAS